MVFAVLATGLVVWFVLGRGFKVSLCCWGVRGAVSGIWNFGSRVR